LSAVLLHKKYLSREVPEVKLYTARATGKGALSSILTACIRAIRPSTTQTTALDLILSLSASRNPALSNQPKNVHRMAKDGKIFFTHPGY
jgi:hypothetical protein